jgi:hypothetical protein
MARCSRYDLIAIDENVLRTAGRGRRRVPVSGRGGAGRESRGGADREPAVFRMDASDSERTILQSAARSNHRPRSYPGDRHGILSLPPNSGEAEERSQDELTTPQLWK